MARFRCVYSRRSGYTNRLFQPIQPRTRLFQSARRGTRAFGYLRTKTECVRMHDKSRFTQNFSVCMTNLTGSTPAGLGEAFHAAFYWTCFDRKKPPPPGGFCIYYVLSSRAVCKRTPLEEHGTNPSRGVLLHKALDQGT